MSQPSLTPEDMSVLTKFKGLLIEFSTYSEEEKQRENKEIFKRLYPRENDISNLNRCLLAYLEMASYSQILIESEDVIILIQNWKSLLQLFFENYNSIKLDGKTDLSKILSGLLNVSVNLSNLSLKLPKDLSRSKRIHSIGYIFNQIIFRIC